MEQSSGTEVDTQVAGNTKKQPDKARGFLIVINHFTEEEETKLKEEKFSYLIYQIEKGDESGIEHIQAFIYYKNPRVWPKKRFPRAHIEKAKSFEALTKYSSKDKTRIRGPYEFGEKPEPGRRRDLEEVALDFLSEETRDFAMDNPAYYVRYHKGLHALKNVCALGRDRSKAPIVTWIYGPAGCGKTRYAIETLCNGSNFYIKDDTQWFDGYETGQDIIIDDFRMHKWDFANLLRLLDRYPYQGQVKGGYVKINCEQIIITTDDSPESCWLHPEEKDNNDYNQIIRRINKVIQMKKKLLPLGAPPSARPSREVLEMD